MDPGGSAQTPRELSPARFPTRSPFGISDPRSSIPFPSFPRSCRAGTTVPSLEWSTVCTWLLRPVGKAQRRLLPLGFLPTGSQTQGFSQTQLW